MKIEDKGELQLKNDEEGFIYFDSLNVVRLINRLKKEMTKEELMKFVMRSLVSALIVLLLLSVFVVTAQAVTVTLTWEMSTMTGVTGFKIFRGSTSKNYDQPVVSVGITNCVPQANANTLCTHSYDIPAGLWFFAAKSVAGTYESPYSNEVAYIGAPINFTIK